MGSLTTRLSCPHCGKNLTAPEALAGKTVRCKHCGDPFQIPKTLIVAAELRPPAAPPVAVSAPPIVIVNQPPAALPLPVYDRPAADERFDGWGRAAVILAAVNFGLTLSAFGCTPLALLSFPATIAGTASACLSRSPSRPWLIVINSATLLLSGAIVAIWMMSMIALMGDLDFARRR